MIWSFHRISTFSSVVILFKRKKIINLKHCHGKNKSMAFIVPVTKTTPIIPYRAPSTIIMKASMHSFYDVVAVSTYIAYSTSQYWIGEKRNDVEVFAFFMAFLWNFTREHDPTIFLFLWLMGGVTHFVSRSFLAGGNGEEFERFHVGVKLGGYMSFLLLIFDLLDVAVGY